MKIESEILQARKGLHSAKKRMYQKSRAEIIVGGDKYGALTVLEELEPHEMECGSSKRIVLCKCDCGEIVQKEWGKVKNFMFRNYCGRYCILHPKMLRRKTDGKTGRMSHFAKDLGISRQAMEIRIERGWDVQDAISIPKMANEFGSMNHEKRMRILSPK